jgi:hypothetical protein
MNTPSINTLRQVFGENAKKAKRVLSMTREQLELTLVGRQRVQECYNPPRTEDIRLHVLNELAGTYGVEGIETPDGWIEYLNSGDTYTVTLLRFKGRYKVGTCGDIAERYL